MGDRFAIGLGDREFAMRRETVRALREAHWRDRVPAAALVALVLAIGGCSGGGSGLGGPVTTASTPATPAPSAPSSTPSLKDKIANFFSGATQREPQPVTNAQSDVECPFLDIRQGASTLAIPPPPPDGSNEAMSLKYQGIFVRAARDCAVVSGQMVMRVGVQGRLIVGPAGGPGQVEVPVRIAIVSAPVTAPKTVVTKLIRIPVTIGANDPNADFTHIEEGLSFPLPAADSSDPYIVYIGFDPIAAAAQDQAKKPAAAKKPKPPAKPNPNAPTG
jgi:hypothetical protein